MNLRLRQSLALCFAACLFVGCKGGGSSGGGGGLFAMGQPKTRSAFDRDPLVMAHLTHHKDDPAYRDTDTDLAKIDEPTLQPASSHTKANKPRYTEDVPSYDVPARSRAPDYQWVRGIVRSTNESGSNRTWFVDYSRTTKDKFGGRLKLTPSPRLGLLREGDPVHLTGRVVSDDPTEPRYEVSDIILLR
jgi:hypothetical protein